MKKYLFAVMLATSVHAEPQLYETGPSEESSYVRFVNATGGDVAVGTGKGKELVLNTQADGRVSRFYKIKSGSKLAAVIKNTTGKVAVEVTGKPWEFISVAVLPAGESQLKTQLLKETPTEFSGSRVSLALLNLDGKCGSANLSLRDKDANYEVKPYALQRHMIAAAKQSAAIACKGVTVPVDLSQLEQGERYSLFLFENKNSKQAFIVRDDKK